MKKLKDKQLGPWCFFCLHDQKRTRATHRQDGFVGLYTCKEHIPSLEKVEERSRVQEEHLTDADRATWCRL